MADLQDLLQSRAREIEDVLRDRVPPGAAPFLSDSVWYQFGSGGKRLRPALCLISCEAFGGDSQSALPFALATELLHNFFLVHDDIEDGDTMRRDKPTLWTEVGVPNAINVGDYIVALAYELIQESPLPPEVLLDLQRCFTLAFRRTVEGQALDINLRGQADVDLETYRRIVQNKTAYYLALPWVGGAVIAGKGHDVLEPLWELGSVLGPAFQIRDDLLDLTAGKGRGGEIGCDLKEGKPSIFYAHVMGERRGSDADRARLRELMARPREQTTEDDIRWAIELYETTGALAFAEEEAARLVARVDGIIAAIPLSSAGRERFREIAQYIVERRT